MVWAYKEGSPIWSIPAPRGSRNALEGRVVSLGKENWLEVGPDLNSLLLDAPSQDFPLKILRALAQSQKYPDPDSTRCPLERKQYHTETNGRQAWSWGSGPTEAH